ncbi:hypothetical protein [Mycolicibacterium iranicum]|uniref:DUF4352 domain-containing protein n=1 Tax=Mycolicibacterium iranicum TaxID=912594 RepID=A0A1X1WL61_MYCIR|nr:hypothetical protein [Mycolicibacterium iranicum]ORV87288.1 hypothetical protein AWC12_16740 [Mycolicibacterium iranicum]
MTRLSKLWQRNVIGAVVVACAVGAYIAIDFGPYWSAYRNTYTPQLVVPDGETGASDGQTWKLESIRYLNESPLSFGPPLPQGTVLTVIVVDWSGTALPGLCTAVLTDGVRRWDAERSGGFAPIPPEGLQSLCHQPGRTQFAFVVPSDAVPTAVDITHDDQITVRLLL